MNISSHGKTLVAATKDLSLKWADTRNAWHDAKSQEFEERYLSELIAAIERTTPVFDDLAKVIAKVRSDCE